MGVNEGKPPPRRAPPAAALELLTGGRPPGPGLIPLLCNLETINLDSINCTAAISKWRFTSYICPYGFYSRIPLFSLTLGAIYPIRKAVNIYCHGKDFFKHIPLNKYKNNLLLFEYPANCRFCWGGCCCCCCLPPDGGFTSGVCIVVKFSASKERINLQIWISY